MLTVFSGLKIFFGNSGESNPLTIYMNIPKRRIGWCSGGGGESPSRAFAFIQRISKLTPAS
jgi:hypothetical protein